MQHFFVPPQAIRAGRVSFPAEQAHQISRVLRLHPGDQVIVLDNLGQAYEVELTEVTKREASGEVQRQFPAPGEPHLRLTLCQALLKARKTETVWQKATELGATRLVPTTTERTMIDDPDDLNPAKVGRWETIIREAAEQSRRGRLPTLEPATPFGAALAAAQARGDHILLPWEQSADTTLRAALQMSPTPTAITLFIGPEGGFTPAEVAQAVVHGALPVTLGPRILRAETAAIATLAAICYELGAWGRP